MKRASKKIIEFIANFEAFRSQSYLDVAGIPTIGYGATYYENGVKVTMNDKSVTHERALQLKAFHMQVAEKAVHQLVHSAVNQNQFDALVSFTYNLGATALKNSTLLKKV